MKKLLFILSAVCLVEISSAQTRKLNPGSTTTDTTINEGMTRKKVINGNKLLHTVAGKYTLYANYVNNRITGYYAIDTKGKKLAARIESRTDISTRNLVCFSCVKIINVLTGQMVEDCQVVPCKDVLSGEKATIRAQ